MKASRQSKKRTLLSMLLSFILIFGSASLSTSLAAGTDPSTHWVKQSPGITEDWHPLIDEFESLGMLDAPMTRGAFERLIRNSFEGLEDFEIPAGNGESHEAAATLNVTRMEGAFYLHHLMKAERILAQQLYTDQPDIPQWALESVLGMTQKGIFKGFPDGSFKSRQWLTHAEAICLVAKSQLQWMREGLTAIVPKSVPLGEPVVTEPIAEAPQPDPAPNPDPAPEPEPQPDPDQDPSPQPEPPVTSEPPVVPDPTTQPEDPEQADPLPEDPQVTDPQPLDPQPTDPQPADPQPEDQQPTDPQPEAPQPEVPEVKPTHTAEIRLILPAGKTMLANVPIELYLVDPDLNTDPTVIETAEVMMFSYDYYDIVFTMTEVSADSDHFLAWITPVFEPVDPFEFKVCELYTIGVYIDYYDPVNAQGVTNYLRSISFDVQPFEY